jgi:TPR repeat protein
MTGPDHRRSPPETRHVRLATISADEFGEPPRRGRPRHDADRAARAFVAASRTAILGDAPSMRRLAEALERGDGVRPDPAAALRWWRRAAEAGDSVAMGRLAPFDRQLERLLDDLRRVEP